jgi:hypothetical protein
MRVKELVKLYDKLIFEEFKEKIKIQNKMKKLVEV